MFRAIGRQTPAPVIGRQQFQRLVHEDAALLAGRELAAVPVQPVEGLQLIHRLPRLARADDGRGKRYGVEGDVVLAHELDVADILGPLVQTPPVAPAVSGRIRPFLGRADIFDGGVEPDVEDLVLHARTREAVLGHRHAPGQVAGDAPVNQTLVQMLVGDGFGQGLPAALAVDPGADFRLDLRLQQIEMARVAHLQVPRPRHRRIGIDQVGRIQQPPAVVALIPARADVAAMGARPLDIAVGQEPGVVDGVDHPIHPLLDQAVLLQRLGEMLGQAMVLRVRRPAEPVVAEPERLARRLLNLVLLVAIGPHVLTGGGGGQLGWGAVLVGGADVEHLISLRPLEPRPDVGRQHRPRQIPQVLDAIDVGQRRGDEDAGHGRPVVPGSRRI